MPFRTVWDCLRSATKAANTSDPPSVEGPAPAATKPSWKHRTPTRAARVCRVKQPREAVGVWFIRSPDLTFLRGSAKAHKSATKSLTVQVPAHNRPRSTTVGNLAPNRCR
jgi:hypothetical protein